MTQGELYKKLIDNVLHTPASEAEARYFLDEAKREFTTLKELQQMRETMLHLFKEEYKKTKVTMPFTVHYMLEYLDKEITAHLKWFGDDKP